MFIGYTNPMSYKLYSQAAAAKSGSNTLTYSNGNLDPGVGSDLLNRYLDEAVFAAEAGFDGIQTVEHHNSAHNMQCVPNIVAASLARQTKKAKLVILGNALPVTDSPLRLAEELSMIDSISRGRLVSGIVRGSGQEQLATTSNPAYNRERFQEAHDLIIKTWTTPGPFRWEGNHFHYRVVNPWVVPVQKPHPPIWVPAVSSPESVVWAAQHGYPYLCVGTGLENIKRLNKVYEEAAAQAGFTPGPQHRGTYIRCHVEETDEKAMEGAEGYAMLSEFTDLWRPEWANPPGYRARTAVSHFSQRSTTRVETVYKQMADNRIIAGKPETVIPKLRQILETARPGIVTLVPNEGRISHERSMTSIRLLGQEVLPAMREMAKELGLNGPFEMNAPISLAHARGAYGQSASSLRDAQSPVAPNASAHAGERGA